MVCWRSSFSMSPRCAFAAGPLHGPLPSHLDSRTEARVPASRIANEPARNLSGSSGRTQTRSLSAECAQQSADTFPPRWKIKDGGCRRRRGLGRRTASSTDCRTERRQQATQRSTIPGRRTCLSNRPFQICIPPRCFVFLTPAGPASICASWPSQHCCSRQGKPLHRHGGRLASCPLQSNLLSR